MPKPSGQYGLIGKSLQHSFSKSYFEQKFKDEGWNDCSYHNFELQSPEEILSVLKQNPEIKGFNVTIPYKEQILEYVNELTLDVALVGACNTIKVQNFTGKPHLTAYNTDIVGFEGSFRKQLREEDRKALILGNGGASKAIAFVLKRLGIDYKMVGRSGAYDLSFKQLNKSVVEAHPVIIQTTPLGTSPNIEELPSIAYEALTSGHYLFDLVYNPAQTAFLKEGQKRGCRTQNGLEMLHLQAEAAWEIWNS